MTAINAVVDLTTEDGVAVVTVDNPPVNALSAVLRVGLVDAFKAAEADSNVQAVVLTCAGRTFIAGADITEFGKPAVSPWLTDVIEVMEALSKPIVAAIHGTALGGGLETALGAHWRVAVASAKLGLPEVKLGLIPGAGGTQRLPRLVGVPQALEMITSGAPVSAKAALGGGLVDEIVEGDLRTGALAYARKVVAESRPLRRVRDMDDKVVAARGDPGQFDAFVQANARKFPRVRSAARVRGGHQGRRRPALRRGHGEGARALPRPHGWRPVQGPAPRLLRRAPGRPHSRRAGGHRAPPPSPRRA